jgi:hypothetical protein
MLINIRRALATIDTICNLHVFFIKNCTEIFHVDYKGNLPSFQCIRQYVHCISLNIHYVEKVSNKNCRFYETCILQYVSPFSVTIRIRENRFMSGIMLYLTDITKTQIRPTEFGRRPGYKNPPKSIQQFRRWNTTSALFVNFWHTTLKD